MSIRLIHKSGSLNRIQKKDQAKFAGALRKAAFSCEAVAKQLVPVDTGALRASIFTRQEGPFRWVVGSGLEYAEYVDRGTRKMAAQPWLTPAGELARKELAEDLK